MKISKVFLKNVLKIFSGNITAQVLNIASVFFLTQILGGADFGGYSVFLAYSAILSSVPMLTYEKSIPNQLNNQIFDYICALCLVLIVYTLLVYVLLFLTGYEYSFFVALYVLAIALNKVVNRLIFLVLT